MKLREVFRFERAYQARRVSTWLYFAVLVFFAFVWTGENYSASARNGDYLLGAPFIVAEVTVIGCLFWILVAAYVAGVAAARDVETGMHPLTYTAPVRKADYLGGRFLAAFVLNASILLAVPAGILLAVYSAGVGAEIRGPLRPAAYLTAYAFIALPNAFVTTAIQFSFAALSRRAIASYLAGILLLVVTQVVGMARFLDRDVRQLLDPLGVLAFTRDDLTIGWTQIELNTRLIAMEGGPLSNRLLWVLLTLVAMFAVLTAPYEHMDVPLLPRADAVLHGLTNPDAPPAFLFIPLLIVFWSGKLVWREREAGLSEIVDAAPVPEWVLFLGKFLGLGLVLALCMALRMTAGMLVQVGMGYPDFEIGLYLQILFGIQLAHLLLLALLALVVHVVVNQKHVGHVVVLLTLICIFAARGNEIGHGLLVFGQPGLPRWWLCSFSRRVVSSSTTRMC